jgi:hypothetical protein
LRPLSGNHEVVNAAVHEDNWVCRRTRVVRPDCIFMKGVRTGKGLLWFQDMFVGVKGAVYRKVVGEVGAGSSEGAKIWGAFTPPHR